MSLLASPLSAQSTAVLVPPVFLTTPVLVSEITGGEIKPEDVQVEWLRQATEEVERHTGMRFLNTEFTNILHGNGLQTIFTKQFPLIEVTSVEREGIILDPATYFVNKRTGSITLREGLFDEGIGNITVVGKAGFNPIPPLIEKIATLIVAKTALRVQCGSLVDSESIGGFNQSRSLKKINDELDRALSAWGRRFELGFV